MNMVIGPNPIGQYAKNVAELCGFVDYNSFAAHGFRRMHVSNNVNNNAPEYERRKHSRHAKQSEAPYVSSNKTAVLAYQSVNRVCKSKD